MKVHAHFSCVSELVMERLGMKKWRLPWIVWASLHQAALGLQYLHHNGIVHGDLKGNNILIGTAGETKLSDFGLSVRTKGHHESGDGEEAVGAFRWKAPECLKKRAKASFEADIYSFGMCIVEAVTGKFPWGNTMDDEAVRRRLMKGEMLQRPVGFQDEEWVLVTHLICVDPADRLTVDALVNVLKEFKYAAIGRIQQAENQLDGFLAVRRHDALQATAVEKLIDFGTGLWQELQVYEDSRLLVKLASTGRVYHLLERCRSRLVSLVKSIGALEEVSLELWATVLHNERQHRMEIAQRTLLLPSRLECEMGDEAQQEEALALLKHCCENYRSVLMPMELDVIGEVYDQLARLSGLVIGAIPRWFIPPIEMSHKDWRGTAVSVTHQNITEASCLRQVGIWRSLRHPFVQEMFACHLGEPVFAHQRGEPLWAKGSVSWRDLCNCAYGLVLIHQRGYAYEAFSLDCLLRDSRLGTILLSGLGLVEQLNEDRSRPGYTERSALIASNVCAFGLAIFALRENNTTPPVRPHEYTELPNVKPDFLKYHEWKLLLVMCAYDPGKRASMVEITRTMKILAQNEENVGHSSNETLDLPTGLVEDVKTYLIPKAFQTIDEILRDVEVMCEEAEGFASVDRVVYDRLVDIYQQLVAVPGSLPALLVEDFSDIVWHYVQLERRLYTSLAMSASRTIANRDFGLHRAIDRLFRSASILEQTAPIHRWQPVAASLPVAETLALRQFENQRYSGLPMESEDTEGDHLGVVRRCASNVIRPALPVELSGHVAHGSFGSVYVGEWLGADVIVKQVLTDQENVENRNQFLQEVGVWFTLNHPNLIRLYGACHEGRPFFVCERAHLGTLVSFARGKRRSVIRRFLCQAAEGLTHLHDLGIVHGDLKGNNILVCENYGNPLAKLADFGLSFYAGTASNADEGALGAFRWKAPECLLGRAPSFESDMYSFGMCILEALSGEYPWGKRSPDEGVRSS